MHKAAILLLACALLPALSYAAPPAQPGLFDTDYAAAMRAPFAGDVQADRPRYLAHMEVAPAAGTLRGTLDVLFRNTTGAELGDVVLRLYMNFPRDVFGDGGTAAASVSNTRINQQAVQASYQAQRSAVRLPLPKPLAPGATAQISLAWSARITPLRGTDDTLPLIGVIPQLAVWDAGWRTDMTTLPDHVYAESSLYHVFVAAPAEWDVASGGVEIGRSSSHGIATTELVTGPVREFAAALGRFRTEEADAGGISVRVLYRRNGRVSMAVARTILDRALHALATSVDRYGPYPYRRLSFCVLEAGRGFSDAREYPGFILLLLDHGYSKTTHEDVAHEVGHQWFYAMVGNDIYHDPWLDEALAQYSTYVVMQQWDGSRAAQAYFDSEIATLGKRARYRLGLSAQQYPSWGSYYASVYGKGGLFVDALRQKLGDAAFFAGLRLYVQQNRYGVAHPDDLRRALERASDQSLTRLFDTWLKP